MATEMTLMEAFAYFKSKMDEVVQNGDEPAYKGCDYADNTLRLYKTEDKSDTPVTINLPEEQFLDQAKTKFVGSFAWTAAEYPGSTDPSLEGKPVMVLAVKGDTGTSYSFVSLEMLVASVDVSAESGNALEKKSDGLYVNLTTAKVTTKEAIDALFTATP